MPPTKIDDPKNYPGKVITLYYAHKTGIGKDPVFYPLMGEYSSFYDLFESGCKEFKIDPNIAYMFAGDDIYERDGIRLPVSIFVEEYGLEFIISHGGTTYIRNRKSHPIPLYIRTWFKKISNLDVLIKDFLYDCMNKVLKEIKRAAGDDEEIENFLKEVILTDVPIFLTQLQEINPDPLDKERIFLSREYLHSLCRVFLHDVYLNLK